MLRTATVDDVWSLFEMEKQASSTGLAHIFGPDIPFPEEDVLARWRLVLEEPGMTVLIDEEAGAPIGYAAFADQWLRHFGVVPDFWGTGRAQALHAEVLRASAEEGCPTRYLWVLVDNHRGRAFYDRHGWLDAGVREVEVFEPYPTKMQLHRP